MSPRTPAQFEALRVEAQDRLERAALVVFARAGYASATVREVAQEAGVSQGLLYNYYDGKQALLLAIFRRGMADVMGSFAAAEVDAPAEARLARLVRAAFAGVRAHLDFWRLLYGLRHQPAVAAALAPELAAFEQTILATLASHLRAVGLPRARAATQARLLYGAIDGVAQHYALDPDGYPIDAVAKRLIETMAAPAPG